MDNSSERQSLSIRPRPLAGDQPVEDYGAVSTSDRAALVDTIQHTDVIESEEVVEPSQPGDESCEEQDAELMDAELGEERDSVAAEVDEKVLFPSFSRKSMAGVALKMLPGVSEHKWERECCLTDQSSRIDFILVEEHSHDKNNAKEKTIRERHDKWREKFKNKLKKAGIVLEEERVSGIKKTVVYVKVHIPWPVMCYYAEDLQLRAPLQLNPEEVENWSEGIFRALGVSNPLSQEVPNAPHHCFTSTFRRAKVAKFMGSAHRETFFATRDRQLVAYEILRRTAYGKKWRAEVGIDRLVDKKVFAAAFPLHDGRYEPEKSKHFWKRHDNADDDVDNNDNELNPRQVLYKYWARWGCWYKYQPLSHVRQYFGEKIAIYFAYLGFYTGWLIPASIIGLLTFVFGVAFGQDQAVKEACESRGEEYQMCPMCDSCSTWTYADKCVWFKLASFVDNPGTVVFSIFMAFWAVTFLEYWKRKSAILSYRWDCTDMVQEEEQPRPSFAEKCVEYHYNPVTGVREPFFPKRSRNKRMVTGLGLLLIMIMVVIIFIIAVIVYRVIIARSIGHRKDNPIGVLSQAFALVSSSIINLIVILILGKLYEKIAVKLTEWEMHRTQSEFDDQLIFKVFVFQFVNFYSAIVYVAFFKGRFAGYPGHYNTLFGLRQEECETGSCFMELAQQCAFIMIGKQLLNNFQEIILPKIKAVYQHWRKDQNISMVSKKTWERDYYMIKSEGLFDEYLETVIQFGFITIFVAAFPLAPLFALLNNWIEIRLDAQKFVCETRRPVAERCRDIGVWFNILDSLAKISVATNAFVIAFTSQFLPKQLYRYTHHNGLRGYTNFSLAWSPVFYKEQPCRYEDYRDENGDYTQFFWKLLCVRLLFIIVFEHVVFSMCKLIDFVVPDIPQSIEFKVKRERYLARQALTDADELAMRSNEQEDPDTTIRARR